VTFIDQMTNYVEAVPVPDTTAATCAKAYATNVVARHGTGQTLITDRGTVHLLLLQLQMSYFMTVTAVLCFQFIVCH
jgi:hypothetical protein